MPVTEVKNYSVEDTAKMVKMYTSCGQDITEAAHNKRAEVVKQLSTELGKDVRSIRSKLVTEKVYIARKKVSGVTGTQPEKKEIIAQRLVAAFGQIEIDGKMVGLNADSMEKANKTDLAILLYHFNSQVVEDAETDVETDAETDVETDVEA